MSCVLMVNDISEIGGGKTAMLDVANVLASAGIELHLACPDGALAEDGAALGMTVHPFEFAQRRMLTPGTRVPRAAAITARRREGHRLNRLANEVGADVVHTGALIPHLDAVSVRPAARVVWHVNQIHPPYLFAGPLPDRIIGVSRAALRPGQWRRSARERATVVPNGVDVHRFAPATPEERALARDGLGIAGDQFVLMTIARLEPSKGVDDLIAAVARTRSRPVLVVVGDSSGYSGGDVHELELRRLATDLGVDARFLGARSDVEHLLHAADAFVFGSRWEAFGLVLAEASACGLPVVSADGGGCAEVIENGVTGRLVPAGGIAVFAAAIDELADDRQRCEQLGSAGRQRMKRRFALDDLADRLLPVYLELLERS